MAEQGDCPSGRRLNFANSAHNDGEDDAVLRRLAISAIDEMPILIVEH